MSTLRGDKHGDRVSAELSKWCLEGGTGLLRKQGITSPPGHRVSSPLEVILTAASSQQAPRGGLRGAHSLCVHVWSVRGAC